MTHHQDHYYKSYNKYYKQNNTSYFAGFHFILVINESQLPVKDS